MENNDDIVIRKTASIIGISLLGSAIGDSISHNNPWTIYGGSIVGVAILSSFYFYEYLKRSKKV